MHAELLRIAYAPAAYYRPLRAQYATLSSEQQRCVNTWLIRRQRLPACGEAPTGRWGRQLLRCWSRLPQVAMLVAAAQLRRRLLCEPAAIALPGTLHHFLRLHPGADRSADLPGLQPSAGVASHAFLQQWGGAALSEQAAELPPWLRARLPLHFAGLGAAMPHTVPAPSPELLWSALRHVEAFS